MGTTNVILNVVDIESKPAIVEIVFGASTVEIRCNETLVATEDRRRLNAWLEHPDSHLTSGQVIWLWTGRQYRLWIRHLVPAHPLPVDVIHDLRRHLTPAPR